MVAELHCHTSEYSACSHVNAVELINRAYELGMQAIIITDHHYQWSDKDLIEIKKKAGVPNIFHVLAGQEFKTSNFGDVLVYGVKETIEKQELSLEDLRKKYPQAAIIWAHPYRHNKIPRKEKLLHPSLDGIEIFSSNYTVSESARALKDWHELKYTAIAGTDTHALSYTGSYPTIFDHPFDSIEGLVNELKSGRCRPYFKEIPRTGTTGTKITEVSIGPKSSSSRNKIILKSYDDINSWQEGERTYQVVNEIRKKGFYDGKFRIPKPLDKDRGNLSLMEEHISGETLYDKLLKAEPDDAKKYMRLAAAWLAKFHNLKLKITPDDEYLNIEKDRLDYYLSGLREVDHPHTKRVEQIGTEVWKNEKRIFESTPEILIQSHGDFHLKNIFIGEDKESGEEYAAAIDFDSSYQLPRAFDVGSFAAQFKNMFFDHPEVRRKAPLEIFIREYIQASENLNNDFDAQVNLYKARTNLSIIYYLVKVGKGDSENLWTILVDSEKSLAQMAFIKANK